MISHNINKNIFKDKKIFFSFRIFLCIIGIAIISMIITYVFKQYTNYIPSILFIRQSDVESLINTIFQIHGGITTLSISILALITGLNKEKYYGIKTVHFMAISNNFILSFYDEIILSLILLWLQLIFVAYASLPAVEFIFLISIIIIIHMLYCCLKVTFFAEKVESEIREFLLSDCTKVVKEENEKKLNLED